MTDALSIAMRVLASGRITIGTGGHGSIAAPQFNMEVRIPTDGPLLGLIKGVDVASMEISFYPLRIHEKEPTVTINRKPGARILTDILAPLYVDFFEKHRRWIKNKFGGDAYDWPPTLNFGRVIRNFISHHKGHVGFENKNAAPVRWHHISYSPADIGQEIIGVHLHLGDLIILMFEMSDELDRAGCPVDP